MVVKNSDLAGQCGVAYLAFVSAPQHIIVIARRTGGFLENAGFAGQAVDFKGHVSVLCHGTGMRFIGKMGSCG